MVRRVATEVHKQVARLARTSFIKEEPCWYRAVLEHPPFPLPPRSSSNRIPASEDKLPYDLPRNAASSSLRTPRKIKTPPIVYLEDEVRRQFFRDHPFEAFRERSIVEENVIESEHPIRGKEWTRLSQRGRNPSPEDTVRFAVNLYEHTEAMTLSDAYAAAVMQYRALRYERHIASKVAAQEVEHYGMVFKPGAIQRGFDREREHLKSWSQGKYAEAESLEARKRWRMRVERTGNVSSWTKGEEYVRLWKEGVRPDYSPAFAAELEEPLGVTETPSQQIPSEIYEQQQQLR